MPTLTWATRIPNDSILGDVSKWKASLSAARAELSKQRSTSGVQAGAHFSLAFREYGNQTSNTIGKHSGLASKDWDFTLSSSGTIKIVEGKDKLSQVEKSDLEKTLNNSKFGYHFKEMADGLIQTNKLTEARTSDNNLGKYHINEDNLSSVLRGRELMEGFGGKWGDVFHRFSTQIENALGKELKGLEEKRDFIYHTINIEA